MLAINDHLLKGSGWMPGWLTGKLSDFAGLVFFPLLATAAVDVALCGAARLGARIDFSLRSYKSWIAIACTGVVFAALKLPTGASAAAERAAAAIGWSIEIIPDPTDLIALPALLVAHWIARRELARVPLGRIEVIERAGRRTEAEVAALLADYAPRDPEMTAQLARGLVDYFAGAGPEPAFDALRKLRAG